jgi:flagellar hook-associated protein 2
MALDIASILSSQENFETLIDTYMAVEEQPRDALVEKQESLYTKKNLLSNLDSTLSALKTRTDRLTDETTDYFAAKTAKSSDTDLVTVDASSSAVLGNHTITVDRLAVADSRVSKQYTDTDTSFAGFSTDQTFSIEVAHPTEGDPENRVYIDVTITADTFTLNDDEVLNAIADAINDAVNTAKINDDILTSEGLQASVITEISGTSRLMLTSAQSGYDYRLSFTDSADSLLAAIEINNLVQQSGTSGGYMNAIGTSASDSLLNSKFTIDGLTLYRNSNNISDAAEGLNIQILNTFSSAETLTITANNSAVKEEIQGFIDSYNELIDFLAANAATNTATDDIATLSKDYIYRNMKYELREIIGATVTGVANSAYSKLFNIGITANADGTLTISDTEKLEDALSANSQYVAELFNTTDTGIAHRLSDFIERFVQADGTIINSKKIIEDQIESLDDRIERMEAFLERREEQLRSQFSEMYQAMSLLNSQMSYLTTYV